MLERTSRLEPLPLGLSLPERLTFDEWTKAGVELSGGTAVSPWALADWIVYGETHYAGRYERGVQAAGLKYQTLRNYAWVVRRFPRSRRRAALSFQHHAEVASLSQVQQDDLLDRAESGAWSSKTLRANARLSADYAACRSPGSREVTVPEGGFRIWLAAADRVGTDVDEWIVTTLDRAASSLLEDREVSNAPTWSSSTLPLQRRDEET